MTIEIWHILADFAAGLFLCNCIPHLVAGLQGKRFPTPFSRISTVSDSPPLVNFYWGVANFAVGAAFLANFPLRYRINFETLGFFLGVLLIGTFCALHFAKVKNEK